MPLPRAAIRPIAVVAAASMWIFISHFRIWPPLERNLPIGVAYALTILAGIAIWRASTWAARPARRVPPPAELWVRGRAAGPATPSR